MSSLYRLFRTLRQNTAPSLRTARGGRRAQLAPEALEDRCVLSTASSIVANFNGTPIPAGDTLWFNGAFTASGLPASAPVTLHVENGAIDFTAGTTPYHVAVPNGVIVLTPGATSASASFDPTDNDWDVSAPSSGAGDVFMGGVALAAPNGLPGGIKNVTWSASFWSDTAGITVNWKWAAAAFKSFSTDFNALGVKPVDSQTLSVYHNGDQSGTPEGYRAFVVSGATGGGGNNYTGNFTPGKGVQPTLGNGLQDYPYPSSNPLTSIAFNESTVLRAANLDTANGYFEVWYSDEHALALGVGTVVVKTASGTTTTNYPIAPLTSNPGAAFNPAVGTTATTGDQAGTDVSGRPMTPSLFISDTTNDPNNRSGDWQWGGTAIAPSAVFGTWKSFTRTVDYTTATPTVTVTVGTDPAKNNWNLGPGSDAPPAGLSNEGYGAEIRWNLSDLQSRGLLIPGHLYRFYVMVHDGDQNKVGGDAGQAAFNYTIPAPPNPPATLSGFVFNGTQGGVIAGVTLTLTELINGLYVTVATTTTAADGSYSFSNLQPGTYQITQTPPPPPSGYVSESSSSSAGTVNGATDGSGTGDVIGSINLAFGNIGLNYNFTDLFAAS
jgi:hypothetical protein